MVENSGDQEGTKPRAHVYSAEPGFISWRLGAVGKPPAAAKSNKYSILHERDSPGLEWHQRGMRPAGRCRIRRVEYLSSITLPESTSRATRGPTMPMRALGFQRKYDH